MKNELKIKAKAVEVHTESGGNISIIKQISPREALQIHAQSRNGGGSADGGDISGVSSQGCILKF